MAKRKRGAASEKRKRILAVAVMTSSSSKKESRGSFRKNFTKKVGKKKIRRSARARHAVDRYQSETAGDIDNQLLSLPQKSKPMKKVAFKENSERLSVSKKGKPGKYQQQIAAGKRNRSVTTAVNDGSPRKRLKKGIVEEVAAVEPIKAKGSKKTPKPRLESTLYKKDPTFDDGTVQLPFVSMSNYSKLAIRAALLNDDATLKRLIADKRRVHSVHVKRSVDLPIDAITIALINNNSKLLKILLDDLRHPISGRVAVARSLLGKQSSGAYNFHMLGHAVRAIQMSRGGREGTNAFLKDEKEFDKLSWKERVETAIRRGAELPVLRQLAIEGMAGEVRLGELVVVAARCGRRRLAGELARDYGADNLNQLHQQVLLNTNEPLKPFKAVSVKKKGQFNSNITPVHCAAINPNVKYIQELLFVDMDFNHGDSEDYRHIHYAAVNESGSVLTFLLQKGASPYDATKKKGVTPLHLACQSNRSENVQILCEFFKRKSSAASVADAEDNEDYSATVRKNADDLSAALKHKSRYGLAPMHYAAAEDNVEVVKMLRKFGAETDIRATASHNNVTPMMLAAQQGHLSLVEHFLSVEGAQLDAKDKLKRTALMHAVINGHAHVASHLLRAGADLDAVDSSGNTGVHYAAAYGWYFCLKLLLECGADLCKSNDWRLTPLSVAYMKGHMGLADLLLQQTNIDINCKDSQGMTLVTLTVSSGIDESTPDQLDYLIKQKHADVNLIDSQGNNALHHLAATDVHVESRDSESESSEECERRRSELRIRVAKLLCDAGCSVNQRNDDSHTPLTLSVKTGHLDLALFLIRHGLANLNCYGSDGSSSNNLDQNVSNKVYFLHDLIKQCSDRRACEIFDELTKINSLELKAFLQLVDADGLTPFLIGCRFYKQKAATAIGQKCCRDLLTSFLSLNPRLIEQTVKKVAVPQSENDEDGESDDDGSDDEESKTDRTDKKSTIASNETAFHILIGVEALPVSKDNDEVEEPTALLTMLLKHYRGLSPQATSDLRTMTSSPPTNLHNKLFNLLLESLDNNGETPLFRAVTQNDLAAAKKLIEFGANLNFIFDRSKAVSKDSKRNDKISVLIAAVQAKSYDLCAELIERGAELNIKDGEGDTALHYACRDPKLTPIVRLLLDSGSVDVNVRNEKQRTPLHITCNADTAATDASIETLEELLNRGASPFLRDCKSRIPLHYAFVKCGAAHNVLSTLDPVAVLTALAPFMSTSQDSFNVADEYGCTPLHYACRRGANISCVTMLSMCPNTLNINAKDNQGNTPFGLALYFKHASCALTLFQAGAYLWQPISWKNFDEPANQYEQLYEQNLWTWAPVKQKFGVVKPLDTASLIVRNEWQGMLYLIMHRLKQRQDGAHDLLIRAALEQRKYNLALTILRLIKSESNAVDPSSGSRKNLIQILADTARENMESELQLKVLDTLTGEFSIDLDSHRPLTGPYHVSLYAAKRHNFRLLKHLEIKSKHKFDDLAPTSDGHTVLTLLLEDRCEWARDKLDWLEKFIENHHLSLNLLSKFAVPVDLTKSTIGLYGIRDDIQDSLHDDRLEQITPLIRVIHMQNFPLCKLLLKLGADVNYSDLKGRTPLMHAVRLNNMHLVKLLLNHDYEMHVESRRPRINRDDGEISDGQEEDDQEVGDENEDDATDGGERLNWKVLGRLNKTKRNNSKRPSGNRTATSSNMDNFSFVKNSQADLHRKDNDGRSILHHLVQPLPYGYWQNVEMLRILAWNGAPLESKDDSGQTAYQAAVKTVQTEMIVEFERLLKLSAKKFLPPQQQQFYAADDVKILDDFAIDIMADAEKYLESKRNSMMTESADQIKAQKTKRPHHLSGLADTGELVYDLSLNKPYSALMTKMDWTGRYGFYNFYRLQLIRERGRDIYIVFTNWGRMGDVGQYQKTSFREMNQALKEFTSIFRAKTGNEWSKLKTDEDFEIKPKKYRPVLTNDDSSSTHALKDIEIDLNTKLESKLPKQLRFLMKDLSDFETLKKTARHSFRNYNFPLVFSSLRRDSVLKAKEILEQIAQPLIELDQIKDKFLTTDASQHKTLVEQASAVYQKIMELTCEFYHVLPLKGFERSDVKIIDNMTMLNDYTQVVSQLLDYERANTTLCAAAYQRNSVHPFDYIYKSLNCRFQMLNAKDYESQYILHYIYNTNPKVKVKFVYKIFHAEKEKQFNAAKNLRNRRMLWHGTGPENLIGILTQGLLPAPFHAAQSGQLFGKGVYTADTFKKSEGYCRAALSRTKYMLLCEVALGNCDKRYGYCDWEKKMADGTDSVKGVGQETPHPNYDVILPTGAIMPLGDLSKTRLPKNVSWVSLHFNEYVCFDPQQVIVRYLIGFKESCDLKKKKKYKKQRN